MRLGQIDEAFPQFATLYEMYKRLGKGSPDYLVGYIAEWTLFYLEKQNNTALSAESLKVMAEYKQDYSRAIANAAVKNHYIGFRVPNATWTPTRLTKLPTRAEFAAYVRRREPFILSMPETTPATADSDSNTNQGQHVLSCPRLATELGWDSVCTWNASYLCEKGGHEPVQVRNRMVAVRLMSETVLLVQKTPNFGDPINK